MPFADDVAAMQADVYASQGVPTTWTPAGIAPVTLTALPDLGDHDGAQLPGFGGKFVVAGRRLRIRVSEIAAAVPGRDPAAGDHIDLADGTNGYRIEGRPAKLDPRRTEWTIELAPV